VGETPWRFKSSHPHCRFQRFSVPTRCPNGSNSLADPTTRRRRANGDVWDLERLPADVDADREPAPIEASRVEIVAARKIEVERRRKADRDSGWSLPFPGRLSVEKRRRVESDKRSVAGVWRLTPIRTNEPSAPTEEARSSRRRLGAAYEAVRQPRLRPAARQSAPKRLRSNLDPCGGAYSGKFALAARPLCSPRKVKADLYVRTSRPCRGRSTRPTSRR
jgi:hypothetical protein